MHFSAWYPSVVLPGIAALFCVVWLCFSMLFGSLVLCRFLVLFSVELLYCSMWYCCVLLHCLIRCSVLSCCVVLCCFVAPIEGDVLVIGIFLRELKVTYLVNTES